MSNRPECSDDIDAGMQLAAMLADCPFCVGTTEVHDVTCPSLTRSAP